MKNYNLQGIKFTGKNIEEIKDALSIKRTHRVEIDGGDDDYIRIKANDEGFKHAELWKNQVMLFKNDIYVGIAQMATHYDFMVYMGED